MLPVHNEVSPIGTIQSSGIEQGWNYTTQRICQFLEAQFCTPGGRIDIIKDFFLTCPIQLLGRPVSYVTTSATE
jgi:hypothetical protein